MYSEAGWSDGVRQCMRAEGRAASGDAPRRSGRRPARRRLGGRWRRAPRRRPRRRLGPPLPRRCASPRPPSPRRRPADTRERQERRGGKPLRGNSIFQSSDISTAFPVSPLSGVMCESVGRARTRSMYDCSPPPSPCSSPSAPSSRVGGCGWTRSGADTDPSRASPRTPTSTSSAHESSHGRCSTTGPLDACAERTKEAIRLARGLSVRRRRAAWLGWWAGRAGSPGGAARRGGGRGPGPRRRRPRG